MDTKFQIRHLDQHPDEKNITGPVGTCSELYWPVHDKGGWAGPLKNWREDYQDFLFKVKNFNTVVQAGGCCGMYARFYADHFTNIITFEPQDDNYHALTKNCVGDKYQIYKGALGNDSTKLVTIGSGNKNNVGTYRISERSGDVLVYELDKLNLNACDLIHLDVENYEEKALLGAVETIKKFKPVVILERGHGEKVITGLGYKLYKKLSMDNVYYYE